MFISQYSIFAHITDNLNSLEGNKIRRNLLILVPCDIFPPIHGSSTAAYFTIKHLSENNKVSVILTHAYSQKGKIDLFNSNLEIRYCPKTPLDDFGQINAIFNPFFLINSIKSLRKNNFDLIQCEILWSMPTGIILKHLYKKPLIFVNENVEYLKFIEMGKIRQAKFVKKLEKFSCKEADLVIALSEIDKKNIIDTYHILGNKIEIIPHGVDTDLFKYRFDGRESIRKKYKISEKSLVISFLGKLDYIPNVTAIKLISELIYPEIIKQHPNTTFLIIGQNYESIVNYKKDNIIFTGYVPPKELPDYLSASDIFIVPLDSGSGTRLKILEAASCSLPIVSTLKGAEGQNFVHGTEIFLTKEIDRTFINHILELIESEVLRKRLGTNARKKIEAQYSWKKIGEKFEKVYSKLLEDSS